MADGNGITLGSGGSKSTVVRVPENRTTGRRAGNGNAYKRNDRKRNA